MNLEEQKMITRHQVEKQKLEEENRKKREEDLERAKTMFIRKDNVIRKNDIITDPATKKIKLDPGKDSGPVVKQDVETGETLPPSDIMEAGKEFGTVDVVEVQGRMNSENMEVEEELKLVTVEEKVDLSELLDETCSSAAASSLASSLRDAALTIEALQKENEKLKTLMKQKNAEDRIVADQRSQAEAELQKETEKLKERDAEVKTLAEQRSQVEKQLECETKVGENLRELLLEKEKELASQNETVRSLRLQLEKTTELVAQKTAEAKSENETCNSLRLQIVKMKELKDNEICSLRLALQPESEEVGKKGSDELPNENTPVDSALLEEKVMLNFNDVMKIFIQHHGKEGDFVNWTKVTPMLKMCRLVCKSWKQSVDFILEQDSSHISLFGIRNHTQRFGKKFSPLPFLFGKNKLLPENENSCFLNLGNFLKQSEKMDGMYNPLPTRHVMIWRDPTNIVWDWEDISQLAINYLKQFGKQVWYLTMDISTLELSPPLALCVTRRLREMLELLPNIRSLAIDLTYNRRFKDIDSKLSFPHLKQLVTFQCYTSADLFHSILANNQHIQRLAFWEGSVSYGTAQMKSLIKKISLHNLSELACFVKNESWKKFQNPSWELESLSLWFLDKMLPPVENIFQGLENLGKKLKFLTINVRQAQFRNLADFKVTLPKLEHLHILSDDWEPKHWGSLLLQLENLEVFTLEQYQDTNPTVAQKKTFLEYLNTFYKKDYWAKLPKLKRVTMSVDICIGNNLYQKIGEPFQVCVKRSKNNVLRFNLVNIEDEDFD